LRYLFVHQHGSGDHRRVMHDDQVDVSVELASRLVGDQFRQWRGLPVRRVASVGTVHEIYRIGDHLAARFPLRLEEPSKVRARIEKEQHAAREFAGISPFPAPEPVAIGEPANGYPMPWTVQTWLPGEVATVADVASSSTVALDLATLVEALRAADTHGRRFAGDGRGGRLTDHDKWVEACFDRSESLVDVSTLRRLWGELRTLPGVGPDVMAHTDLVPGNVLVRHGRIAGVLDTGDFAAADRALDLVGGWHLLDPQPRSMLRERLGCDDTEWARGMAWALQQAIGLVWYYRDSNPVMSRIGRRTLDRIVAARADGPPTP
jgi:aminoglycoside phosphotransferase (APT) family kinase protein